VTSRAEAIARAALRLSAAGVPEPARDARLLARWAAGLDGAGLAAALGDAPGVEEAERFEAGVARREARVPLAQITGERAFWGRPFRVTAATLDPRPETETLVAEALAGPPARRILDLGTGTGCILLTLLAEWPGARGVGTDVSEAALAVARENAERLGLAERAGFVLSDWFAALPSQRFDVIVSNPPYVTVHELEALAPETRLHEPRHALTPGGDGLDAYRAIATGAGRFLAEGGRLLLETGAWQGPAVAGILAAAGLAEIRIVPDMDGRDRVMACRMVTKGGRNAESPLSGGKETL
jgi:release factor glutamine methyltransferase